MMEAANAAFYFRRSPQYRRAPSQHPVRKHAACRWEQLVTQFRAETGSSLKHDETQVLCSSPQRIDAAKAASPQTRRNRAAAAIARLARNVMRWPVFEMACFSVTRENGGAALPETRAHHRLPAPAQGLCSIQRSHRSSRVNPASDQRALNDSFLKTRNEREPTPHSAGL
jgi:hypothetical protein